MNKEFCMECGAKNLYEVNKPKFCCGCGDPLNTSIGAKSKSRLVQKEEDEDDDAPLGVIDMRKLKASISVDGIGSYTKLDEVWSSPSERVARSSRPSNVDLKGMDLLKQTQNDCAPTRQARDISE